MIVHEDTTERNEERNAKYKILVGDSTFHEH
jgi:hypothetical protein